MFLPCFEIDLRVLFFKECTNIFYFCSIYLQMKTSLSHFDPQVLFSCDTDLFINAPLFNSIFYSRIATPHSHVSATLVYSYTYTICNLFLIKLSCFSFPPLCWQNLTPSRLSTQQTQNWSNATTAMYYYLILF